jgi:ketosteroid isomerase-like protein
MKSSILKFSMTFSLPLLLSLFLTISFSSCSEPNLGDIVREHINAVNNDDVEKNLALFTDDIVFEIFDDVKLSGKDQLRGLMENDVVNKARLTINDMKVEGDTVIAELTQKNEVMRLLGIDDKSFNATYKFRGCLLEKVKVEVTPEGARLYNKKYKPFAEWASKEHPQEFSRMESSGLTAEHAKLLLSLLKEWRDTASAERLSTEQEFKKLEQEIGQAWAKRDITSYDQILADDYTWTDFDGIVWTKAQDLETLKSGEVVNTFYEVDDWKVRVYGDAAIVTGCTTVKETWKGRDTSGKYRYTDTWVKLAGRWQLVASHTSKIAQK